MDTTHYVLGTACGPHPFPEIVSYFQSIIGKEANRQIQAPGWALAGSCVYACWWWLQCNGDFSGLLDDDAVELIGCEAEELVLIGASRCAIVYPDASIGGLRVINLFTGF